VHGQIQPHGKTSTYAYWLLQAQNTAVVQGRALKKTVNLFLGVITHNLITRVGNYNYNCPRVWSRPYMEVCGQPQKIRYYLGRGLRATDHARTLYLTGIQPQFHFIRPAHSLL